MTDFGYWRKRSEEYEGKYSNPERVLDYEKRHRLDAALNMADVPASGVVVDIGVGSGELFNRLEGHTEAERVGVDFSRDIILAASGDDSTARYVQGDGGSLPLATDSVDLLFCLGVVGHIGRDGLEDLITEIARVLRPGGQLLFSFANSASPFRKLRNRYVRLRNGSPSDYDEYDPRRIVELLSDCGLSVEISRYLTYATGLVNTPLNIELYKLLDDYCDECSVLSRLAMTWVVRATRDSSSNR
ncbi:class I SAM-dependent methyltransferase [Haloarcula onubensis]|uniref:Methyltransferase domain-containing protein n=1 Tax=Haloarcula onubensis TaxID=2950539 RepID=A0ABU2FNF4_9EURY|nr:methyltransferase domain-containing protein [Halomicroarcula sp. S3CR25-11]MDS0282278.1 methyltransferase domain-containing protein [Halomicroarcula sp. S3CR25-11]